MTKDFSRTEGVIKAGQADGAYPGTALSTGDRSGELFRFHYGFRSYFPEREALLEDTLFDMASVTKIMAPTMVALKLIESGKLKLSDKLGQFFSCPDDKKDITVKNLMTHTSGLPAHVRLYHYTDNPKEAVRIILEQELLYQPGGGVTYSCLGYITLGRICESICSAGLDKLARDMVFEPLGMTRTSYNPTEKTNVVTTEYSEDLKDYVKGVVHDENARFLGGVSGNAGVFSTIGDCAVFAQMLANKGIHKGNEFINRDLFLESIQNHTRPYDEGRGLGFVVKNGLPSSAGNILPDGSYGHTGFTGTSIWVDIETSQYIVFLTNRVHPTRENAMLVQLRKDVHNACAKDYRRMP